jgi:hypothetical protein
MKKVTVILLGLFCGFGCVGTRKPSGIIERFEAGVSLNNLFSDKPYLLDGVICDTVIGGTSNEAIASASVKTSPSGRWLTIQYSPRMLFVGDQFLKILKGEVTIGENLKIVRVLK